MRVIAASLALSLAVLVQGNRMDNIAPPVHKYSEIQSAQDELKDFLRPSGDVVSTSDEVDIPEASGAYQVDGGYFDTSESFEVPDASGSISGDEDFVVPDASGMFAYSLVDQDQGEDFFFDVLGGEGEDEGESSSDSDGDGDSGEDIYEDPLEAIAGDEGVEHSE